MNPRDEPEAVPARVRVTAPRQLAPRSRAPWQRRADPSDESALYVLTLIRAQLRLGLVVALCFAVTLALAAICLAVVPLFGELTVLDVPVSWVLQAYGMYPLVVVFALIYVRGARRNEQRYRSLEQNR
jgi:hypothetical protein